MNEPSIEHRLLSFLRSRGYPAGALVLESRIRSPDLGHFAPDVTIVDPQTREQLAIFELKQDETPLAEAFGATVLELLSEKVEEQTTQVYLVGGERSSGAELQFYRLRGDNELVQIASEDLPSFKALAANKIAAVKSQTFTGRKSVTGGSSRMCRRFATVAILMLLADVALEFLLRISFLNPTRLAILAAIGVLLVLPYAAELKLMGFEWKRAQEPHDC